MTLHSGNSTQTITLRPTPLTVHQALAAITAELPSIGKGDKSPEGYQYRGIEAVTKHLQPLLAKHGVIIAPKAEVLATVPSPAMKDGWQDVLMRVEWTVYGPDGTSIEAVTNGIGRDRSDKGANKAQTQAYKYLLLHLFCIADGKDDADSYDPKAGTAPKLSAKEAKGRLLSEAGGDKEAAAAAWDKAGLSDRRTVTEAELTDAVGELHELGWSWAPNGPGSEPGPPQDDDAGGDTATQPAETGRADMDTPPASSGTTRANAAGQTPPVGLNARQVALRAGTVFKADYDAAPKGHKTRTADRLRHALTWTQTGGKKTSLAQCTPPELHQVWGRLDDITEGRLTYKHDKDCVMWLNGETGEPLITVPWTEIEGQPGAGAELPPQTSSTQQEG